MSVFAHLGGPVLEPAQLVALVAYGGLYALRARTLATRGRPVPVGRRACFYGGLAVILLALASPLGHVADELFSAHMVEHLLIADVGALLLVIGLTGPVLAPVLRLRVIDPLRRLAHPVPAFALWVADLIVWHLPALYQGAVAHPAIHALEHLSFVAFGMLMWAALLGPLPKPAWFGSAGRLGYVLAVRLTGAALANVLLWSGGDLYPRYAAGRREWGISAQQDQSLAGAVMMIEGSLLTLGLLGWLFLRAGRLSDERDALLGLAAERGVVLDTGRAERAVAAGRGAELRERVERS